MTPTGYWITNVGTTMLGLIPAMFFAGIVGLAWPIMKAPAFVLLFSWWVVGLTLVVSRDKRAHLVTWMTWREAFKRSADQAGSNPHVIKYLVGILSALTLGFISGLVIGLAIGVVWPGLRLPAFFLIFAWCLVAGIYVVIRDRALS